MGEIKFIPSAGQPNSTAMVRFYPEKKATLQKSINYENVKVYEEDEDAVVMGSLGHPVFMPLKLEKTSYEVRSGNGRRTIEISEMFLPVAIIEADRTKNAEMTPVEGMDGTVKEYGSHGDWLVTVRGMVFNDADTYPEKELKHLLQYEGCPVSVEVACDLFSYIGVKKLFIRKVRLVPTPEFEEIQAFEMDCVQDAPNYELIKRTT